MLKPFCDDCKRPIEPEKDNFIELGQIALAKDGKVLRAGGLHFCGKDCLNSWLVKNLNRPTIITPNLITP